MNKQYLESEMSKYSELCRAVLLRGDVAEWKQWFDHTFGGTISSDDVVPVYSLMSELRHRGVCFFLVRDPDAPQLSAFVKQAGNEECLNYLGIQCKSVGDCVELVRNLLEAWLIEGVSTEAMFLHIDRVLGTTPHQQALRSRAIKAQIDFERRTNTGSSKP